MQALRFNRSDGNCRLMSLRVALRRLVRRIGRFVRSAPRVVSPPVAISELVLREAAIDDLRALAELHVRTFNETHLGPFGSGPTYSTRESQWRDKLSESDATHFVLVLETGTQQLVGFIWCHPTKDNPRWGARLNKIYLLREYQRRGLGKRMVAAAVNRLLEHGFTSMALFTEVENEPACNFYEQLGGERQVNERGDFEGMYGWPDLRRLRDELSKSTSL
jgi:ribosomal protein S18 acetylase RimI-like enzyme